MIKFYSLFTMHTYLVHNTFIEYTDFHKTFLHYNFTYNNIIFDHICNTTIVAWNILKTNLIQKTFYFSLLYQIENTIYENEDVQVRFKKRVSIYCVTINKFFSKRTWKYYSKNIGRYICNIYIQLLGNKKFPILHHQFYFIFIFS